MENRYDKILKNIEVTTEMRDRILNNINDLDLDKARSKVVSFQKYRKYLSIAASFVILFAGAVMVRNMINLSNEANPPIQVIPDIVGYSSVGELSKAVGFTVEGIHELPFVVESVQYTVYWGELAEIQYTGQNNTVLLRSAEGDEDISGDYIEYTNVKNITINGDSVTLKGNDDKYVFAAWQTDGVSYALQFAEAIPESEILTAVQSVK